jgi:hypothetical protein
MQTLFFFLFALTLLGAIVAIGKLQWENESK